MTSIGFDKTAAGTPPKIQRVCEMIQEAKLGCGSKLEGWTHITARLDVVAGAHIPVAGTSERAEAWRRPGTLARRH